MTVVEIPLVDLAQIQESGGVTVGGATAVAANDGDASFLEVAYGTRLNIDGTLYADSTSDAWTGFLAPATDLPAGATIDGINMRFTYRTAEWNNTTYSSRRLFVASDPDALATHPATQAGAVFAYDVADSTAATWVNLSMSAPAWRTTTAGLPATVTTADLRTGGLQLWLYEEGNANYPTNRVRITEVVLLVSYTPPADTPPLRQCPRNDGLAGSARRMWPPPRSTQGSIRRLGGYL